MRLVNAFRAANLAALTCGLTAPAVTAQPTLTPPLSRAISAYTPNQCFRDADDLVQCFTWQAQPDRASTAAVYPAEARAARTEGIVTLRCVIGADRKLAGCVVVGEYPTGSGFAEAALSLAPAFKVGFPTNGADLAGQTIVTPVWFPIEAASAGPTRVEDISPPERFYQQRDMAAQLGCSLESLRTGAGTSGAQFICRN